LVSIAAVVALATILWALFAGGYLGLGVSRRREEG
jgi:hypothetical protein